MKGLQSHKDAIEGRADEQEHTELCPKKDVFEG